MGINEIRTTSHEQVDAARTESIGIHRQIRLLRITEVHLQVFILREGQPARDIDILSDAQGRILDRHLLQV